MGKSIDGNPKFISGSYVPTFFALTNIVSITIQSCYYVKIENIVYIFLRVLITPNATTSQFNFDMSIIYLENKYF